MSIDESCIGSEQIGKSRRDINAQDSAHWKQNTCKHE